MSGPQLYLVTPVLADAAAFAASLADACATGGVAAVLIRLAEADERTAIDWVKLLAPVAQARGAAALVTTSPRTVVRGGADGVHLQGEEPAAIRAARDALTVERIVGAGGLRTRHDAMTAGEAGVDYVMFGEPQADGTFPAVDATVERAAWWAEIFEVPCVAYAPSLDALEPLAATGAEFLALGDAVWNHRDGPADAVRRALAAIGAEVLLR